VPPLVALECCCPVVQVLGWLLLAQLGVWGVLQVAPMVRAGGPLAGQQAAEQHAAVLPDVVAAAPPGSSRCMPEQPGLVVAEEQPMAPEVPYSSGKQCPLCLSPRSNVTCTPCGHLYCWDCIAAWCLEKPECPLCRAGVVPSQLVCVYHSDL
jgi:peroxin-10